MSESTTNPTTIPPVVIAWGSNTGFTEGVAKTLAERLAPLSPKVVDIGETSIAELTAFDVLILGIPTWHVGEFQDDWDRRFSEIAEVDFRGKKVAIFGCGDAAGYPDTFQDAMGLLWKELEPRGATLIGLWPTEGYKVEASKAMTDDGRFFLGLALDEHSQYQLSDERIDRWADQLLGELGLAHLAGRSMVEAGA